MRIKSSNHIKHFVWIVFIALTTACGTTQPEMQIEIKECAKMPYPRATAVSFSIGSKAYVFGGRDSLGNYLNDIWQYNSTTDKWINLGPTPLASRVNAIACVQGDSVYIGLGFAHSAVYAPESYLHDWWCWTPSTNTWTQLARYPYTSTVKPITYALESRIYAIYGTADCFTRDITYYDIPTNSWHILKDNHRRARAAFSGVGATCQGQTFYGLGYNTSNLTQWFTMNLEEDYWVKCKSIPGKGRTCSACCSGDKYIYVFGGRNFGGELSGGEVFADILRYDHQKDNWTYLGLMPCGEAENQISFRLGRNIYFGLGENKNGKIFNSLYCFEE